MIPSNWEQSSSVYFNPVTQWDLFTLTHHCPRQILGQIIHPKKNQLTRWEQRLLTDYVAQGPDSLFTHILVRRVKQPQEQRHSIYKKFRQQRKPWTIWNLYIRSEKCQCLFVPHLENWWNLYNHSNLNLAFWIIEQCRSAAFSVFFSVNYCCRTSEALVEQTWNCVCYSATLLI